MRLRSFPSIDAGSPAIGDLLKRFKGPLVALFFLWIPSADQVQALPITGSNGRVVEFAGVKSAGPAGLKVQIQAGGDTIDIAWEKLDLTVLKTENPIIQAAYENAKTGTETELNLGSFAPMAPAAGGPVTLTAEEISKVPGRYTTSAGGGTFILQMPQQGAVRAVLLIAIGQDGRSTRYLGSPDRSQWAEMAEKLQLAVMAYDFPAGNAGTGIEKFKVAPFIYAEKGSGEGVIKALENIAKDAGKPELATAPIAIYGQDALGSAFAFNFTQAFPERVIATVASKGAFYSAKPTEESAKVPLLFIWGQYDEDINLWKPTDTLKESYEAGLALKPNWISAMELRTGSGMTPISHHMAMTFLNRMILARLTPEGKLQDLDRTRSFVGDLDTAKISRMEDPEAVIPPNQTWLPDGEIAKMWEDFNNGMLAPPNQDNDK